MFERTIIVPETDNYGVSLRHEQERIETALLDVAGGYTADKVTGAWRGEDGRTYRDRSTRYVLALTEAQDAALVALLPQWASDLRQQALYTSVRPVTVSFVEPLQPAHVA